MNLNLRDLREEPTIMQVNHSRDNYQILGFGRTVNNLVKKLCIISHCTMNNRRNRTRNGILIILRLTNYTKNENYGRAQKCFHGLLEPKGDDPQYLFELIDWY